MGKNHYRKERYWLYADKLECQSPSAKTTWICPAVGADWGFKTKLQHTHFLMVMSFFALSFRPYLSISDATRQILTTNEKRLTWKRSVVRIHYSPPSKMCAFYWGFWKFGLSKTPPRKGLKRRFTTLYNTLRVSEWKVCTHMKLKQTGSVFDNHGLWYYSVQLPGEKKRRQEREVQDPGVNVGLRV